MQVARNSLASGVSVATTLIANGLSSFVETKLQLPVATAAATGAVAEPVAADVAELLVPALLHATNADNIKAKITLNPNCFTTYLLKLIF